MVQMTSWVHQYTLRDLLDDSFDLFKARFTTLLLAAMLPAMLVVAYVLVVRYFFLPGNLSFSIGALLQSPDTAMQDLFAGMTFWYWVLYIGGFLAVGGVAAMLAGIVQCRIAVRHAMGETVTLRDAFTRLAKPFWSLALLALLFVIASPVIGSVFSVVALVIGLIAQLFVALFAAVGALISPFVGMVLGAVAGFAVSLLLSSLVLYSLWTPLLGVPVSLAVEHTGPFTALGRSFKLAGSNFKAHFTALLLISQLAAIFLLLGGHVAGLLQFVTQYLSPTVTLVLGTFALVGGMAAVLGSLSCLQALVYLDGRSRRENLELRLLAEQIGLGEEIAQAFAQPAVFAPQMGYPDYTASAAPPVTVGGGTAPAPAAFDYAAPPPPTDTPPAAATEADDPQGGAHAE